MFFSQLLKQQLIPFKEPKEVKATSEMDPSDEPQEQMNIQQKNLNTQMLRGRNSFSRKRGALSSSGKGMLSYGGTFFFFFLLECKPFNINHIHVHFPDDDVMHQFDKSNTKEQGNEQSSSYLYVKRQRRRTSSFERRSISVMVTTFDCSSSGDETIYSAQGSSDVAICHKLLILSRR